MIICLKLFFYFIFQKHTIGFNIPRYVLIMKPIDLPYIYNLKLLVEILKLDRSI